MIQNSLFYWRKSEKVVEIRVQLYYIKCSAHKRQSDDKYPLERWTDFEGNGNVCEMRYEEAKKYLNGIKKYGSVLGLKGMTQLLDKLGHPERDLQFVHVAGTNGKGSVVAFLSTILTTAGYKTGKYISPAVFQERENIQVDGSSISEQEIAQYVPIIKKACEEMLLEGGTHPTIFEFETAMAFWHFQKSNCDIVVLETGLGGVLDATNVICNTRCAVITSISMDHIGILGNTISEIAKQKAGIIKPGCMVVSASQKEEVQAVIMEKAKEEQGSVKIAEVEKIRNIQYYEDHTVFDYKEWKNVAIGLLGTYQPQNAIIALEAANSLRQQGWKLSETDIYEGLKKASWPGRFSILSKKPLFVIDGAHNEEAALRLKETLETIYNRKKKIFIIGVLSDKEYEKIITITGEMAKLILTVTPPDERALDAKELARICKRYNKNVISANSLMEAVERAEREADADTMILAFGSLSYLGDLTAIVLQRKGGIKNDR